MRRKMLSLENIGEFVDSCLNGFERPLRILSVEHLRAFNKTDLKAHLRLPEAVYSRVIHNGIASPLTKKSLQVSTVRCGG